MNSLNDCFELQYILIELISFFIYLLYVIIYLFKVTMTSKSVTAFEYLCKNSELKCVVLSPLRDHWGDTVAVV